tara:strand:+ start:415 stop:531 length:117 start_codon:yes stop_codon:yes gene_type:complete
MVARTKKAVGHGETLISGRNIIGRHIMKPQNTVKRQAG